MTLLLALLNSKKFMASMVGVLVAVLAEVGLDLDPEALLGILSPILTYVLAQGVADHGKEKAKIEQNGGLQ